MRIYVRRSESCHQLFWFQIPMHDFAGMDILNGTNQLLEQPSRLIFGELMIEHE